MKKVLAAIIASALILTGFAVQAKQEELNKEQRQEMRDRAAKLEQGRWQAAPREAKHTVKAKTHHVKKAKKVS
jgi:hypothetical protein